MAVHDPAGDPIDAVRTTDGREIPMSEHTIVVATDADRPVERWVGDRCSVGRGFDGDVAGTDLVVVGPERGAEFGLDPDGGVVVASLTGSDGPADVSRSTRFGVSVDRETLREAIARLDRQARYDALLAEFARLATRRGALEAERDEAALAEDREYRALRRRLADVEAELDSLTRSFDGRDFRAAFETAGFGEACKHAD